MAPSDRRSVAAFRSLRPHAVTLCLCALAAGAMAVVALTGWRIYSDKAENHLIRGLAGGRDLAVPTGASAEVLLARAHFLLLRGRIEEAEALIGPMTETGRADRLARLYYDLGNGRLRAAFDGIEDHQLDEAIPQARLAKDAFRRSLVLVPGAYDAKSNLDLAMRLARDFPDGGAEGEDDPKTRPKNIWTELPGRPEGLP